MHLNTGYAPQAIAPDSDVQSASQNVSKLHTSSSVTVSMSAQWITAAIEWCVTQSAICTDNAVLVRHHSLSLIKTSTSLRNICRECLSSSHRPLSPFSILLSFRWRYWRCAFRFWLRLNASLIRLFSFVRTALDSTNSQLWSEKHSFWWSWSSALWKIFGFGGFQTATIHESLINRLSRSTRAEDSSRLTYCWLSSCSDKSMSHIHCSSTGL